VKEKKKTKQKDEWGVPAGGGGGKGKPGFFRGRSSGKTLLGTSLTKKGLKGKRRVNESSDKGGGAYV